MRRILLLTAALAAGALAWFAPTTPDDASLPLAKRGADANPVSNPRLTVLPERAAIGESRGELFAPQSWAPSAPAAEAATPPTPSVPANPYRIAGTTIQSGATSVFLFKGDRVYEAKAGIELEDGYRVESIASDHVVLLYVPLGLKQVLSFSSSIGAEIAQATPQPASAPLTTAGAQPAPSSASKAAQLRWQGPESVRAGSTFSVSLHVSSDQQLRASPMQLRFEPEFLEPLDVRPGKFFGQGSFSYRTNPEGTIFVGASGRGAAPGKDAELVVLTFRSRRAGATAQVSVGTLALQDPSGRALAHDSLAAFRTAIQ